MSDVAFRSRYDRVTRDTMSNDGIKPIYAYDHNENKLVEVGKKNHNEYVKSFYEISLLSNKIKRFQNGDITALNSRQGVYLDVSGMPTDFNSMHKLVTDALLDVEKNDCKDIPQYIQLLIDKNKLDNNLDNSFNTSITDTNESEVQLNESK